MKAFIIDDRRSCNSRPVLNITGFVHLKYQCFYFKYNLKNTHTSSSVRLVLLLFLLGLNAIQDRFAVGTVGPVLGRFSSVEFLVS
jgi:hypothetical protein